jgi:hypothetical protein
MVTAKNSAPDAKIRVRMTVILKLYILPEGGGLGITVRVRGRRAERDGDSGQHSPLETRLATSPAAE